MRYTKLGNSDYYSTLSPKIKQVSCRTTKTVGAVNSGQCPLILTVDWPNFAPEAGWFYSFFRVKKIPMTAPRRIIGDTLTNSHSNE